MDAVRADPGDGTVLFAAGVFYYFTTEEVKALATGIARRFPRGRLVFDAAGQTAVRLMLKNLGEAGGHPGCGRLFFRQGCQGGSGAMVAAVFCFQPGLYAGLSIAHDPAVRPVHRLLAKLADGPMHLQIVRIDFAE